jgi:lipid-binding SYLF domain-containing protein
MSPRLRPLLVFPSLLVLVAAAAAPALGATDAETVKIFQDAGQSGGYFAKSYGYAVFPSIAKGGLGVGAAHGKGHAYVKNKVTGEVTMNQVSVGLQAGGEAYAEIIFFEDQRAYDDFTSGNFEFSAQAQAVAITAGASASAGTTGTTSGASASKADATTAAGGYQKGMAVFTVAKGGLMYEASIGGQKFKFKKGK